MIDPELQMMIKREQYREYLAAAARDRLVVELRADRPGLTRRMARPLGRALLRAGTSLLRYARVDAPATTWEYGPPVGSVKLN